MEAPLYCPPDVWQARDEWGANCGPGAIAAAVGRPLAEVRELLGPSWPGYTNPTHMRQALRKAGFEPVDVEIPHALGLGHVQWCGPWEKAGPRVAYKYTHCIAYRVVTVPKLNGGEIDSLMVYDINAGDVGDWLSLEDWEHCLVPELLPKKATGHRVRLWIEAMLPSGAASA